MVTTGAAHDTTTVEAQLEAVAALTGVPIQVATMDAGYAITRVFADLEARKIEAVVPAKALAQLASQPLYSAAPTIP